MFWVFGDCDSFFAEGNFSISIGPCTADNTCLHRLHSYSIGPIVSILYNLYFVIKQTHKQKEDNHYT